MSKSKNKSRSEVEHLKGIIRRLKSQLKYYRKRDSSVYDNTPYDEDFEEEDVEVCEECGKGVIEVYDFYKIIIRKCNLCGYEEKERRND